MANLADRGKFNPGAYLRILINRKQFDDAFCFGLGNGLGFSLNDEKTVLSPLTDDCLDVFCDSLNLYMEKKHMITTNEHLGKRIRQFLTNGATVPLRLTANKQTEFLFITEYENDIARCVDIFGRESEIATSDTNRPGYDEYSRKEAIVFFIYAGRVFPNLGMDVLLSLRKQVYRFLFPLHGSSGSRALESALSNGARLDPASATDAFRSVIAEYLDRASKICGLEGLKRFSEEYRKMASAWAETDCITEELMRRECSLMKDFYEYLRGCGCKQMGDQE